MKISKPLVAAVVAAVGALPAVAFEVVLGFEGISTPTPSPGFPNAVAPAAVDGYYSGVNSLTTYGNAGTNYGVSFEGALGITAQGDPHGINAGLGGTGLFFASSPNDALNSPLVRNGNPTQPNIGQTVMTFGIATSAILNRADGFSGHFSFNYSSLSNTVVSVWDGLGATGTKLGELNLGEQAFAGCKAGAGFAGPFFCNWSTADLTFNDTAKSIRFLNQSGTGGLEGDGGAYGTGIDNITLYNAHTSPAPEPSTYALMALGLLGVGFTTRKRMR